jgi:hypothetical protein
MNRAILIPRLPNGLEYVDACYVKARLENAGATLLSLPATGTAPSRYKVAWPEMVQAVWDAYKPDGDDPRLPVPSAQAITAMDEAFQWIPLVGEHALQTKRLIWLRLLVHPLSEKHLWGWRKLERMTGLHRTTMALRHSRGIDRLVTRLNNPAFVERSGNALP